MSTMLERALSEVVANVNLNEKIRKPKTTRRAASADHPIATDTGKVHGPKPKKGGATPAQLKAAKGKLKRRDWIKEVAAFRKARQKNIRFEMGSPGSAQVTRVRLVQWTGFHGLACFTRGSNLYVSKLKLKAARIAAVKVGK